MIEPDSPEDIVNRLRGKIIIPINDGLGPLDGKDYFERDYGYQGDLQESAAQMLERLIQGEQIPWGEVNALCLELQKPDDPMGIGKEYIVPIRNRASWTIHEVRKKLES